MQNRSKSNGRYQQEPSLEQVNLKERQLYLQSSSINPLTGAVIRQDQQAIQQQQNNSNREQKLALQQSSINPLTGQPIMRNPVSYQIQQQQNNAPFGTSPNQILYQTSSQQIGGQGEINQAQFQRNLMKFFAADDSSTISQRKQISEQYNIPNDDQFQRNLIKFYGADDPSIPKLSIKQNQQSNVQNSQNISSINEEQFQRNLVRFFAADDNTIINKKIRQQTQSRIQSPKQDQVQNVQQKQNLLQEQVNQNINQQQFKEQSVLQQEQILRQKIEQDPRFVKNLKSFFGVDDDKLGQGIQGAIQQQLNKQQKILVLSDSSSSTRQFIQTFFKTRGIEDYDAFVAPGGVFQIINNKQWENCFYEYLDMMNKFYSIKELYLISVIDINSNMKLFLNNNDKRSHQIAVQELKGKMNNQIELKYRLNGIVIDQRGASEKVF